MLIHGGADIEIADSIGEKPIHIVAREGLLSVCQLLCSLNCSVNVCNKSGLYPIHLAAKNGHIEIVRTLCLTSCIIDQKNRDGITAEISALAQGFKDIAELLVSIKNETLRAEYINSLIPSGEPLTRVKLKLLGHSGVGKTTLVESLKCGYFSSWFRRSSRGVTAATASAVVASLPSIGKRSVLAKNSISSSKSSLDASPFNTNHGDIIIFSPLPPVDRLVAIVAVVRLPPVIGSSISSIATSSTNYGNGKHSNHSGSKCHWPNFHAYPINNNTNTNTTSSNSMSSVSPSSVDFVNREVATVYQVVMEKFSTVFDIHNQVLIMDSHAWTLESVMSALNHWRKALSNFPILTYGQLITMIREQINPLTGEEHVNQIFRQLVSMGEIFYLKSKNDQDLIVLCPKWLTSTVVGNLLSEDQIMKSPISGRYSVDEMQDLFPSVDALDLLQVLESLSLCTQCDSGGDIEYEFPYFIKQERPESPLLIADSLDDHHSHHDHHHHQTSNNHHNNSPESSTDGSTSSNHHNNNNNHSNTIMAEFGCNVIQILRLENNDIDNSLKLEQFCNTVKLSFGPLMATLIPTILSCSLQYEAIELRVIGPRCKPLDAFHFFYDLLSLIESSIGSMAPALLLHRHYLSPTELAKHKLHPLTYSPSQLIDVALKSSHPLEINIYTNFPIKLTN
ncbi:death-associated protein kinase dapk-1-like [Panonychus citri]|uniref:death-associated protein kinase dapk-1-like n=1 Tax=Panonychus citri TaxID=50023 RepID=UPI002307113E|nr:death-associated protein kinase dapk-1-like [Panonychus citri]